MEEFSPLPVGVRRNGTGDYLVDAEGYPFATVYTDDAPRLAKAVNNHDKLVEALEYYANGDNYNSYGAPETIGDNFLDLGDVARKALAALKEEAK